MMRKETDRENLRIKYSIYPMSIESWLSMEIPDQFPKLHQWIQNLNFDLVIIFTPREIYFWTQNPIKQSMKLPFPLDQYFNL